MQRCAELGIKLTLKADDNERLLVDAPKGTLTAPCAKLSQSINPN